MVSDVCAGGSEGAGTAGGPSTERSDGASAGGAASAGASAGGAASAGCFSAAFAGALAEEHYKEYHSML